MSHSSRAALLLTLAIIVSSACGERSRPEAPAASAPTVAAAAPDSAVVADSAGCGLRAVVAHPDPAVLVNQYLARDGAGEFTESSAWLNSAMACPGHAPGWDGFTLITGYEQKALAEGPDTARFMISYTRHGYLEQDSAGFVIRAEPGTERDTVVAIRTPFGWRIGDPVVEPHVLPAAALARFKLGPAERKTLTTLARKATPVQAPAE